MVILSYTSAPLSPLGKLQRVGGARGADMSPEKTKMFQFPGNVAVQAGGGGGGEG